MKITVTPDKCFVQVYIDFLEEDKESLSIHISKQIAGLEEVYTSEFKQLMLHITYGDSLKLSETQQVREDILKFLPLSKEEWKLALIKDIQKLLYPYRESSTTYHRYKILKGLIINKLWVEREYQEDCIIETDNGLFRLFLEAECCSTTFVGDVIKADYGLEIKGIRELKLHGDTIEVLPPRDPRQEHDKIFGISINFEAEKIEHGWEKSRSIILVFRNSSNGYYGGSLEKIEAIDDFDRDKYIPIEKTPVSFS